MDNHTFDNTRNSLQMTFAGLNCKQLPKEKGA